MVTNFEYFTMINDLDFLSICNKQLARRFRRLVARWMGLVGQGENNGNGPPFWMRLDAGCGSVSQLDNENGKYGNSKIYTHMALQL